MCPTPTGLDYAGVEVVRRAYGIRRTRDLMDRLRILEGAAVEVMVEAAEREMKSGRR